MDHPMEVVIVGLGVDRDDLTLRALRAMEEADAVFVRTDGTEATRGLAVRGIAYESFDPLYERCGDYDELCEAIAAAVTDARAKRVVYAVPGSAAIGDSTVAAVAAACRGKGIGWTILPGVGWETVAAAGTGGVDRAQVTPAARYAALIPDPRQWLLITEIDRREVASELKLRLLDSYPADHEALLSGAPIPLSDLDRQRVYRFDTTLAVPPQGLRALERFDFYHLTQVMAILRDPVDGCPWDGEQTHESLKPYVIEEAYEVVDAIDGGGGMRLADELGDLLLQAVFHARIGEEHGEFAIGDVTTAICRKMIARHTHIFGDDIAKTSADVLVSWEANKRREKGLASHADVLKDVPRALPALMRAQKLLKKAANAGMSIGREAAARMLAERAEELLRAEPGGGDARAAGEMLLWAVELARAEGFSVETALYETCEAFVDTFSALEAGNTGEMEAAQPVDLNRFLKRFTRKTG